MLFPTIKSISDVLVHIQDRKEFSVIEKDDYKVIQYNVELPDTFEVDPNDPIPGLIRRECRGISFASDTGKIIRRPFQKFFNVNQKEETQQNKIDLSVPHRIYKKVDGSLIAPFMINEEIRFGTKRGETDISVEAETFARRNYPELIHWIRDVIEFGYTPMFEWISPTNRIVIEYKEPQLILLASRHMESGHYHNNIDALVCPIPIVESIDLLQNDMSSLVNQTRELEGEEGYVISFEDGFRVKIKSDWYVQIHKSKEILQQTRHIILADIDGTLDDILSLLPESEHARVEEVNREFWAAFSRKEQKITQMLDEIKEKYHLDMKRISLEYMPSVDKVTQSVLYELLRVNGSTVFDVLLRLSKKYAERGDKAFSNFCKGWLGV